MSFIRYIERLKRMDNLIKREATGNSTEFAKRMGVSESQLFQDIKEMKTLGAPVAYCPIRKSYFYLEDVELNISFEKGTKIKGAGTFNYYDMVYQSESEFKISLL